MTKRARSPPRVTWNTGCSDSGPSVPRTRAARFMRVPPEAIVKICLRPDYSENPFACNPIWGIL